MLMKDSSGKLLLESAISTLQSQKRMAERAVAQLPDDALHKPLDENTNSVAVTIRHIAGNMRSRWTDFLTADGEKPWRGRDGEFIDDVSSREELMKAWEEGWKLCIDTVSALSEGDLGKTVYIRGEAQTAALAILRQLSHYGYHIGQIVLLARFLAKVTWQVLTIPRGQSEEYNRRVWKS